MPIPAALIGAGASLLGSVGSSLIQNAGNRRAVKEAAKQNVAFWRMQNEYNHPSAQMARLQEAGLNPNLIYGTSPTSAVGNAESIAPRKAAEYKMDNPLQYFNTIQDFEMKSAQTDNFRAQNDVIQQEAALKAYQQAESASRTSRNKFDLNLAEELRDTSMEAAKQAVRNTELRNIGQDLDNTFKDETLKDRIKALYYEARNAEQYLKGQQLGNKLKELDIELRKIGIQSNDPWYFRVLGRNWEELKKMLNFKR
jgi:hypothetical protein